MNYKGRFLSKGFSAENTKLLTYLSNHQLFKTNLTRGDGYVVFVHGLF